MYTTINMLGMIRGHVDRMELLKKQDALVTETPDEKVNPAILVKNIVGTANVPIRATINAPEAYGGIRLLGIPGCGTVVCHADQIENVYKAVDTATGVRVRRVLRDVLGDDAADKYDVSAMTPLEKQKFLEQFGQPISTGKQMSNIPPITRNHMAIKKTKAMADGTPAFYTQGRTPFWLEDLEMDR